MAALPPIWSIPSSAVPTPSMAVTNRNTTVGMTETTSSTPSLLVVGVHLGLDLAPGSAQGSEDGDGNDGKAGQDDERAFRHARRLLAAFQQAAAIVDVGQAQPHHVQVRLDGREYG